MGEVDILDVNPDTFKQMLEFIYTGQVTIHTFSKSLKLVHHNRWEMRITMQNFSTLETNMNSRTW